MHILIAPNAFKNSLSGSAVAEAIKKGFSKGQPTAAFTLFPIADGGEGLTDILVKHFGGSLQCVTVQDALGKPLNTNFGLVNQGTTAVIELAKASGISTLGATDLNPLLASTFGTGQIMQQALDLGIRDFVIGLGNSATVDGGTGILRCLGVAFLDHDRKPIVSGGKDLGQLATIDVTWLDERLATCRIQVLCDVDNPLLGDQGAARVFGPQKGADATMVEELEQGLTRFNEVVKQALGKDMAQLRHGGAAGGTAAALATFLGARLVPGIDYLLDVTGFKEAVGKADVVITAEGGLDTQTLSGKGPYGVARLAKERGLPVIALVGQIPAGLDLNEFPCLDAVFPIGTGPVPLEQALLDTAENLCRTANQIANLLSLKIEKGEI